VKTALFLCNRTPTMYAPWLAAGYQCWSVDLQHPAGVTERDGVVLVGADVRTWIPPRALVQHCVFACGFPPCTDIAVSGARWFRSKGLRALSDAIDTFGACVNIIESLGVPGFVENPVSVIASHYRKPDFTFDPCDFGDPYTKKTCLWAFGGWLLPPKTRVEPTLGSKMHLIGPSEDRGDIRSETPPGFAAAVFNDFASKEAA
jgi:hypothetical protein